jgi:hypothetical protein
MTAPDPQPPAAPESDVSALRGDERATLLRVLDWGVETRNMTHLVALKVLAIADRHAALIVALAAARERVRVVEGERDAARAERDEMSGWIEEHALVKTLAQIAEWQEATGAELPAMARAAMHAYAARAESAEAAHEALRAGVEALADDFASNVDWSAGRNNYGDNEAWESAARQVRALLAGGAR